MLYKLKQCELCSMFLPGVASLYIAYISINCRLWLALECSPDGIGIWDRLNCVAAIGS